MRRHDVTRLSERYMHVHEYVCGDEIPKKGKGYEIVEHKATSLVGKVDHGANAEE